MKILTKEQVENLTEEQYDEALGATKENAEEAALCWHEKEVAEAVK